MTLLRLALATGILLLPGAVVARALGLRGASVTLAWSLALLFGALAVTFAVGASLSLTLVLLLAAGVVALRFARRAPRPERVPGRWWMLRVGIGLGVLLWHVAGEIGGDGLFHLARVRKLEAFDSLSLDAVNEFADGGLHPGYAFPLWHGFLALVARVSFLDPADVVLHEASVLAPLAVLVAYEAGYALFRRVGPAVAVVCAQVAVTALAPAHGGAYTALGLPATASRQLLVPAALALAFAYVERPTRGLLASTAAAGLALAVIHPTYAIFLWLPFAGFLVVRSLVAPGRGEEDRDGAGGARRPRRPPSSPGCSPSSGTRPRTRPGRTSCSGPSSSTRASSTSSRTTSYRLAPEVFGRAGAVAVAALLLVPLAGLALRRRWAAYVLGGFLAVAAVMLVPLLFVPFSDLVSLSQSRRAAGFWPLAFAFAGGLTVLAAILRGLLLPVGAAGRDRAPARLPGRVRLPARARRAGARDLVRRRRRRRGAASGVLIRKPAVERPTKLVGAAAVLFVLPIAVHAAWNWSPSDARPAEPAHAGARRGAARRTSRPATSSTPISETSYRIAAFAPVYIAAAPPGHVADTEENRPYERRDEANRFFETGDVEIPRARRCGLARRRPQPVRRRPAARQRLPRRALHALRPAVASSA